MFSRVINTFWLAVHRSAAVILTIVWYPCYWKFYTQNDNFHYQIFQPNTKSYVLVRINSSRNLLRDVFKLSRYVLSILPNIKIKCFTKRSDDSIINVFGKTLNHRCLKVSFRCQSWSELQHFIQEKNEKNGNSGME